MKGSVGLRTKGKRSLERDTSITDYTCSALPGTEKANYTSTEKLTWDQWHQRYGHISISTLQTLEKEKMVNGLSIDQSLIPSKMCDACTEAKQAHQQFPQEAENRSQISGECFMMDVWGPARVTSIGGWKYYISFCNDSVRYFMMIFLKNKGEAAQR